MSARIVLIDNQDSFVYNLVDALAVAGFEYVVYRNTIEPKVVFDYKPDLIVLSPGPGHPLEAGSMMEIIKQAYGTIPILGICLGFQALLEHFGGDVRPVGPVHGVSDIMELTEEGVASGLFEGLTIDSGPDLPGVIGTKVPVARYHSLGCTDVPAELLSLATCTSDAGTVTMAARTRDNMAIGLQFHPESVLTPSGPHIINRCIEALSTTATQPAAAPSNADATHKADTADTKE